MDWKQQLFKWSLGVDVQITFGTPKLLRLESENETLGEIKFYEHSDESDRKCSREVDFRCEVDGEYFPFSIIGTVIDSRYFEEVLVLESLLDVRCRSYDPYIDKCKWLFENRRGRLVVRSKYNLGKDILVVHGDFLFMSEPRRQRVYGKVMEAFYEAMKCYCIVRP